MKKIFYILLIIIFILSCKIPKIIKQNDDKNYSIIDWEGGTFVYVTYIWEGGKFEDAIDIIKEFIKISEERGLKETAIGRFPADKEWQLGILIKGNYELKELNGKKIEQIVIPAGTYAKMSSKGYPEYIFIYWKKLKKWLENDGYIIKSPVFEIYNDAFDKSIDDKERKGELRYRIKEITDIKDKKK